MRGNAWTRLLLSSAVVVSSSRAHADGITLERYSPPETIDDGLEVSRPIDSGHLRPGVQLHVDYANDPLVFELEPGDSDSETTAVVSDQLVGNVGLSLGLWNRLVLFAGLSANLWMKGEDFRDPNTGEVNDQSGGTSLGNTRVGARVRLFGERSDAFALALQVTALLPTAELADDGQHYAGESDPAVLPELLLEVRPGPLHITVNAGVLVHKNAELIGVEVDDELSFALGVGLPLADDRLELNAEAFGATSLKDIGDRESTPVEFLGGAKFYIVPKAFVFGIGAGAGLQRGVGAPDFRALATLRLEPQEEEPAELPPEVEVRDMDGDGFLDPEDGCPREPEDKDGFEDRDGCPDPDNDKDGIPDTRDKCPLEPEDTDDFEDADGCPDPDNDQDGFPDTEDQCPLEPEDKDGFEDENGCPDPDNDKDGVLDVDDACPTAPGPVEEKGCPKAVRVEEGRIVILERVEFGVNKDVILKGSEPVLTEVRAVLEANPRIEKLRVEGHTDGQGADKKNMDLSRRRAASVARWLSARGIDAERLEAYGCGENLPIDDNGTKAGRQANRRVEFHILVPAPKDGARNAPGCERQPL